MRTALILAIVALSAARPDSSRAEQRESHVYKVGVTKRSFVPGEPYNWRGAKTRALLTTIWYPADADTSEEPKWIGSPDSPFASAGKAGQDAKMVRAPARFPLILLSHGTGGSALMMAWLGTQLAANGYIAAAVNHPGNNGTEKYMPQGFGLWWERAKDLSTLTDQMTADATFQRRIDPKRIAAAGAMSRTWFPSDLCKPSLLSKVITIPPRAWTRGAHLPRRCSWDSPSCT